MPVGFPIICLAFCVFVRHPILSLVTVLTSKMFRPNGAEKRFNPTRRSWGLEWKCFNTELLGHWVRSIKACHEVLFSETLLCLSEQAQEELRRQKTSTVLPLTLRPNRPDNFDAVDSSNLTISGSSTEPTRKPIFQARPTPVLNLEEDPFIHEPVYPEGKNKIKIS